MRKDNKKYYYQKQLDTINEIGNRKPSLLMHTCCAICACFPALYLSEYFDLTLFFNNDNIYPEQEYDKRFNELVRLVDIYNHEKKTQIKIIKTDYQGPKYLEKISALKDEPEGGQRCQLCYYLRMREAIEYAANNNYEYCTTVMTVSRQKNSRVLNEIGEKLQSDYPNVKYFFSDFKKSGGLEIGNKIANEYQLYHQNYCGCLFSLQARRNKND